MMNTQQPNAIKTLINLLNQEPPSQNLEITILPLDDYETTASTCMCTSTAFLKDGIHFGIHAPHIPQLAREFRVEYHALRHRCRYRCRCHLHCSSLDDSMENDCTTRTTASREEPSNVNVFQEEETEEDIRFRESITCLLLLCPDHATGWADRRHLLLRREVSAGAVTAANAGQQEVWSQEIQFLDFMFTQHSKAPNAWSHRKWVCKQILKGSGDINIESICQFATHEISKCCEIAEKKPKNYYAWTHRLYIVQSLAGMVADADINADIDADVDNLHQNSVSRLTSERETTKTRIWNILDEEVKSIEPWLKKHVSDHSAAHYGGQILRIWLDWCGSMHVQDKTACTTSTCAAKRADTTREDGNFRIMEQLKNLQDIMDTCTALIESFPSHEVIWIWRRICSQILIEFVMTLYSNPLCSTEEKGILSAVMTQFVKSEILVIYDGFEIENSISQDECQSNHHSVTYILWILKQFHKHECFQLISDELQMHQIGSKLECFLANSDRTSCKMWEARRNMRYTS